MLIQCGLLENSILTVTDCWGLLIERQVEKPKNNFLLDVKNEINGSRIFWGSYVYVCVNT